ncbi:sensor histidine kinase [Cellulomonas denverensis]|uniref:histidine kinase n=1 Tax=Cellulomonas denverensis TaxID=264297 RepID=A0A7X6KWH1_9CELL|nr:ATP-binding protein [Cellulomonas denverensis]NKY23526.1 HAMP domain-containing protein [Cellulomonas denverensis]GIG24990.1 two-component sensor histidine kinase [Cellulomonas denverensis]
MAERRGLSVRARTTLAAAVVVGLVLVPAVLVGQWALQDSLTGGARAMAEARAQAVADQLERGGHLLTVVDLDDPEELVQVIDADGAKLGASATARGLPLLTGFVTDRVTVREPDGAEQSYVLASASMAEDAGAEQMRGGTVVVGRALTGARELEVGASVALVAAAGGLLILVAGTTWWLVGRALRPVERMREQADAISHRRLDRRLPATAGRDEVARLSRTLNAMLDRLDHAARAQRRFISDASHELRTPLTVIRQNAELVLSYPDRVDAADLARGTVAETERMQDLVDGLLVLSRSDEQRLRPAAGQVDLDDLLLGEGRRVRAAGRLRVNTSGVTAVRVRGDRSLLGRVVRNLVDNAARHAASTVALRCGTGSGWAVIDVDDDGAGVPVADRERVFARFVRLDESRARDAGGSGLGLAIVREVVQAHGGHVRVLDSPTGGARLRVWLPPA